MAAVREEIVIDAPLEHVFSVIADVESYPVFLPETQSVTVLERGDTTLKARFELEMQIRIEYVLELELEAPKAMRWKLVEGRMLNQNDGAWELEAIDERSTRAVYTLDVKLTRAIPNPVSDRLLGMSLPQTLQRFKERAEGLLGPVDP